MKKLTMRKVGFTLTFTGIICNWIIGMYACHKWGNESKKAAKYRAERDALLFMNRFQTRLVATYGTDDPDKLTKLGASQQEIDLARQWHKMCESFAE
jgi:hypothetical protein